MQPLYDAGAVRTADALAEEQFGLPGAVLMENAGHEAALALRRLFPQTEKVCLCCGGGNNGGDGFVLARHLAGRGIFLTVLHTTPADHCTPNARANLRTLHALGIPCFLSETLDDETMDTLLQNHLLAVDALLGTGSQGAPRGQVARMVQALLRFPGPVVALDVPSGVNASDGTVASPYVRATQTFTFLAPKVGLFVSPGAAACGDVHVLPIGIPAAKILPPHTGVSRWETTEHQIPDRSWHQHKGSFGTVLVVGGSASYPSAPLLAARAVLRAGGGGVVLAMPESSARYAAVLPEAVHCPLPGSRVTEEHWSWLTPWFDRVSAVLVGPGLGRHPSTGDLVRRLWAQIPVPLVADADALFALSEYTPPRSAPSVVTPHEGEAARLLSCAVEDVRAHRLDSVRALAARWSCALLKGAWSLASDGKDVISCSQAAPVLAVPGSGDVLSGIVATLLAQEMSPLRAAALGSALHARCGALRAFQQGDRGMLAEEIADGLPGAMAWEAPLPQNLLTQGAPVSPHALSRGDGGALFHVS